MKPRTWLVYTLLCVMGAASSTGSFLYGRHTMRAELDKAQFAYKYTREQLQMASQALANSPSARLGRINSRYHTLLKKHGIDPEKEGVFDK